MKKTLLHSIVILLALFFFPNSALAQEKIKFGKIPIADLQMKQYDLDSTAHAVILYDKGHLRSSTEVFTRHVRVKVLDNAGTGYANFQVRTTTRSDISGSTFNLVNGVVEETSLEKENIFREEIIEGFYTYKIFFPAVRPGSVVELEYSFRGLPYEWRFQDRIPVRYSELVLEPTKSIVYKKTVFGSHPLETQGYGWIATDVPAFVEEPYMCHYSNYLTHFKMDIQSISIYGGIHLEFSSSWEKIGERLMDNPYFGGVFTNSPFLNSKADEIKNSSGSVRTKIRTAYDYIKENITWNGWASEYATDQYWANFKKNHKGNSAEINLLLIALLRKSGITTYPVIMSTRDNGLLNPTSASMTGLNYVVGYVKTDSVELLLDATEPELVPGMLPARCKNISAYVVDDPAGWWLDTSLGKGNTRKQFIRIQPDAAGNLVAEVTSTHLDYDYMEWMKVFKERGSEEAYIRSVIANTTNVPISACEVKVNELKMSVSEKRTVNLTGTEYVQDLGSETLVNPFVFYDVLKPFKREERQHPIDFIYPRTRSAIVSVQIPDNYTLRKLPEECLLTLPNGGARFSLISRLNGNLLTIVCTLKIEKQIFSQAEYGSLRQLLSETHRRLSEPLQIDKKT